MLMYLACPYSHPDFDVRKRRFNEANRYAAKLFTNGYMVFSPISHTHPIAAYGLPGDWKFWEAFDRVMLERCEAMIVLCLDGWKESKGVQAEIEIMREMKKPIAYVNPEEQNGTVQKVSTHKA